ncbi:hypothetical protein F0562_026948 [Nyssa sinensis]|uniref:Uncharacterized protein n=1 Tax=Nyssa sinensis TaxID=561372 RepID=A0A5J5B546_9ASTE|nr:hypothetical protein F0562_026948 [Nyssa sinensis]
MGLSWCPISNILYLMFGALSSTAPPPQKKTRAEAVVSEAAPSMAQEINAEQGALVASSMGPLPPPAPKASPAPRGVWRVGQAPDIASVAWGRRP